MVLCLSSVVLNVGPQYRISYDCGCDGSALELAGNVGLSLVIIWKCCDERLDVVKWSMLRKSIMMDLSLGNESWAASLIT